MGLRCLTRLSYRYDESLFGLYQVVPSVSIKWSGECAEEPCRVSCLNNVIVILELVSISSYALVPDAVTVEQEGGGPLGSDRVRGCRRAVFWNVSP